MISLNLEKFFKLKGAFSFKKYNSIFLLKTLLKIFLIGHIHLKDYFAKYFFNINHYNFFNIISNFDKKINTFKRIYTNIKSLADFGEKKGDYNDISYQVLKNKQSLFSENLIKKTNCGFRLFFFFYNKRGRKTFLKYLYNYNFIIDRFLFFTGSFTFKWVNGVATLLMLLGVLMTITGEIMCV